MDPMKSILAATDFSAPSLNAARRAAALAREHAATVTLMHVVPSGGLQELRQWLAGGEALEQRLHEEARERLAALADELRAGQALSVRTVHTLGAVVDDLLIESSSTSSDLVVVGARGAGLLRRLVLGTTAERLLRRASRPVLVARRDFRQPYRRLLVGVDFSPWSAPLVALARKVAARAHLVLLHAFQIPFEEKLRFAGVDAATLELHRQQARAEAARGLCGLAQAAGLAAGSWDPCIVEGEAWQRIVEHEQLQDCELVVLGKHGRTAAEDLLLGSVTERVLAEGAADVLVSTSRDA